MSKGVCLTQVSLCTSKLFDCIWLTCGRVVDKHVFPDEFAFFFQADALYKCELTVDGSIKTTDATWISETQLTCSPKEVCKYHVVTCMQHALLICLIPIELSW